MPFFFSSYSLPQFCLSLLLIRNAIIFVDIQIRQEIYLSSINQSKHVIIVFSSR
jgi:hypothetical protein